MTEVKPKLFKLGQVQRASRASRTKLRYWIDTKLVVPTGPRTTGGGQATFTAKDALLVCLMCYFTRSVGLTPKAAKDPAELIIGQLDEILGLVHFVPGPIRWGGDYWFLSDDSEGGGMLLTEVGGHRNRERLKQCEGDYFVAQPLPRVKIPIPKDILKFFKDAIITYVAVSALLREFLDRLKIDPEVDIAGRHLSPVENIATELGIAFTPEDIAQNRLRVDPNRYSEIMQIKDGVIGNKKLAERVMRLGIKFSPIETSQDTG